MSGGREDLAGLLGERARTHGDFARTAATAQGLKSLLSAEMLLLENRGGALGEEQREALDSICTKLARIVCGDPNHADHWRDIAGYAGLVVRSLAAGACYEPGENWRCGQGCG